MKNRRKSSEMAAEAQGTSQSNAGLNESLRVVSGTQRLDKHRTSWDLLGLV